MNRHNIHTCCVFVVWLVILLGVVSKCKYVSSGMLSDNADFDRNLYGVVHPNQSQCLVKPFSDPVRFEWKINCFGNNSCDSIKISLAKMSPTFCLAIQLFSERDYPYVHINESLNYYTETKFDETVMPTGIRFRIFCYFQDMGAWDYTEPPKSFCLTRNGYTGNLNYTKNCTKGYANEELDEMISEGHWNFTLRKPFQQYSMKLTKFNLEFPLRLKNLTGLQMHIILIDQYNYPDHFELRFLGKPYFIIPLIVNYSLETTPYWDIQCNELTYNSRPQYYIWKMVALLGGLCEFSIILVFLIVKRKHRIIESRFIIPIFSMSMYIIRCMCNVGLNIAYADPEWDTLIEQLVIIVVMSLHMFQGIRYYLSRFLYVKYYSKRDGLLMKILLSKVYFLVGILSIIFAEAATVSVLIIYFPYAQLPTMYNTIAVLCCAGYFLLLVMGVLFHFFTNISYMRKLKNAKKIFKWFFLYDDPFGYNGEFLVLTFLMIMAGIHYGMSEISANFLTQTPYDDTRPISKVYLNNGFGYFLYGSTKILLTLSYGLQYIFLILLTTTRVPEKSKFDLKKQKEEMDLFLSKIFHDGTSCIEIFKRFLISEFELEWLEIYQFLTKHPKSTISQYLQTSPGASLFISMYIRQEVLENCETSYKEVTRKLLESFARLKQTMIYEEEYLRRTREEIQYVFDSIK